MLLAFLVPLAAVFACGESAPNEAGSSRPFEADAGRPQTADSGVPGARLVGRWDDRDPAGPRFAWPGTRVVMRFNGTGASVRWVDTDVVGGPSLYDVIVDGTLRGPAVGPTSTPSDAALVTNLPSGEHVVELVRRTEGALAVTQLLGASANGGALLPPPPPSERTIEFVGDSETNGYGIEGDGPDCAFSAETQNVRKAYPFLVADALSAEPIVIAASGKGVLRNADQSDTTVFDALYPRALPSDSTSRWRFGEPTNAVVIALGGNDWERPDPDVFDPPDQGALEAKYLALVEAVRASHPSAHVFCAHPASLTDDHPEGYGAYEKMKNVLNAVVAARVASGDARVHYFEFPRATDGDRTGCDYHYGPAFHAKMAEALTRALRDQLGW